MPPLLSRRSALAAFGAWSAWLAAGSWPGRLAAEPVGPDFAFVVANDFHHVSPECDAWFEALFRRIGGHPGVAFCVGLGDLAHQGAPESLEAIGRLSRQASVPFYAVPGNHDNDLEGTTALYARRFPDQLNHTWQHGGWRFVAVDTTDGARWGDTTIQPATLSWLDRTLPECDPIQPTVLLTHFPLARGVKMVPLNADALLARFVGFNLQAVFSGHYHGQTTVNQGRCTWVTNVCCSRVAGNHDGTVQKGYWLCRVRAGVLEREFVAFTFPAS